jgi:hypothetical protein
VKPDPAHAEYLALRRYVETVADLLGVETTACWCEYASPSTACIALADRSPGHPDRLLMLQWSSDTGWCLALEPERHEAPAVVASWPAPLWPHPASLARQVHAAIEAARTATARPRRGCHAVGLPGRSRACAR